MRVLKAAEGEVLDLAFSPDGRALAAAVEGAGTGLFLWNLETPSPSAVKFSVDHAYGKGSLTFSDDSRNVSWVSDCYRTVYQRAARDITDQRFEAKHRAISIAQSADCSRVISQHGLPDYCLIGWHTDGETWVQYPDDWIRSWAISTAELAVESVTLSGNGRLFAMLTRPAVGEKWQQGARRVEVRDAATAKILSVGEYPYNTAEPLLFSPDACQLVGFNDMTLLVWPVPDVGALGSPRLIRNDNRKQFTALAYHPSGRHLYATSNDTTVHVFDTANWNWVGRFTWQLGRLKAVAVSPDGMLAAAGGDKGDVVIWDIDG